MQISLLKVFSHEIHQIFENDLEALGSLKQLKYFYNLPIGQVFEALSQLYKPNPNSNYWKATQTRIYDNDLSSKRVCDFLKVRILNQSFEIKFPPWTILWFRILGIFSVENIQKLCVFMFQTWDNK